MLGLVNVQAVNWSIIPFTDPLTRESLVLILPDIYCKIPHHARTMLTLNSNGTSSKNSNNKYFAKIVNKKFNLLGRITEPITVLSMIPIQTLMQHSSKTGLIFKNNVFGYEFFVADSSLTLLVFCHNLKVSH